MKDIGNHEPFASMNCRSFSDCRHLVWHLPEGETRVKMTACWSVVITVVITEFTYPKMTPSPDRKKTVPVVNSTSDFVKSVTAKAIA